MHTGRIAKRSRVQVLEIWIFPFHLSKAGMIGERSDNDVSNEEPSDLSEDLKQHDETRGSENWMNHHRS